VSRPPAPAHDVLSDRPTTQPRSSLRVSEFRRRSWPAAGPGAPHVSRPATQGERWATPAAPVSDALLAAVYRHAAAHGGIETAEAAAARLELTADEVSAAVEQLLSNRLLREEAGRGSRLVAVDPEIAAALLVAPMEQEIAHRRELIAQVRERTETLRQDYVDIGEKAFAPAPIEHVTGCLEVRGSLKLASDTCRDEVLVLLSGQQEDSEFNDYLRVCRQLLERGVAVRLICQHRSRADLVTRMKIKQVVDAGAQVRTVSHLPRAAVVFDRALAVLLSGADGDRTAARVRDGEVVRFLIDMFEHLWDGAAALSTFESGYAEVADDLQQTIAGLMAKGFTDEVLARKMGMSVRTCRRHIAALMHELNAVSRFQAGVLATRRSIVPDA
jgi:DNA-binding CsgD family transcriptional regulator